MKKLLWGILISTVFFSVLNTSFAVKQNQELPQSSDKELIRIVNTSLKKIQNIKGGIDDITQELFALDAAERAKNPQLDDKYRTVRNEMVRVISSIWTATTTLSTAIQNLAVYQEQIDLYLKDLQEVKKSFSIAKDYYTEYVTLLHKIDLELYDPETDKINELRLLINSDNINKTLISENLIQSITLQLEDIIKKADQEEEKKTSLLIKLGNLKQQATEVLDTYYEEIDKLEQKKQYLIRFLELYKEKQNNDQVKFQKFFSSKKDVNTSVQAFLDEIVQKNYKSYENIKEKIINLEHMDDASNKETSPLAWPVYPITEILRYFWDQQFQKDYGFKFQGIQVLVTQGTPIYAMRDGVVYHTFDDMSGISWIMIVHQKGYVTVYQYLNSILVKPGDIVQRGQIIWYSWWEPGTKGAGFVSEGENLTFAIYQNGVAVDPLSVLDLSVITNWQNVLSEDYKLKYLSDVMVRPIDVSNLQIMEGSTVNERSQNFLDTYGKGIYRDLSFWDTVVEGTNIDRDMVICVAFAESTLGHYLATANNIGNVGNNDRGDRIAYSSPYQGARLIAETLNNAFLGDYHTIKQLSRYGNKDGKIYASSPINWQTNVLKCLSKIKGYTIPEDFPFRTGPNPNR